MKKLPDFSLGRAARDAVWCLMVLPAGQALANDNAALQRCRAIAEPVPRLACYDALPLPAAATPVQAALPAPVPSQRFGQESRDEPQALASYIVGVFEGWRPRSRITLANGQVWQVIDDSEGIYFLRDPKVTVRRATLGGFQLDIEGANRTPRVRRVQ